MLIGAHVSTAGGLAKAVARGVERGCDSIQIFSQSPRAWKPTAYTAEDFAEFNRAMSASRIGGVIIHAIYLINPAAPERELREKSLVSLTAALRVGDEIGAAGVVLHPGSRKQDELDPALQRAGELIGEAVAETESCPVLIEQMAGHQGILGFTFGEIAAIIEAAGGSGRIGLCLDTCHLFASGYDIRDRAGLDGVLTELDREIDPGRPKALHINDSKFGFGERRDRHADLGRGQIGRDGLALFLSEPRFEGVVATLETPGQDRKGPAKKDVTYARRLRTQGLRSRDP
ncbi:MAG: deoxyribonuclease IV [Solirubrobacterales bacterium]|nr:deoxyribonuclease IV [Solirubrobacterales bacterium]